jgi:hypothetical protein
VPQGLSFPQAPIRRNRFPAPLPQAQARVGRGASARCALIRIKAVAAGSRSEVGAATDGDPRMSWESLIVVIVIVAVFSLFATVLAWADHRTRRLRR